MKIYQRFVITNYIRNLFVIFLALEFFYVGIDLLTNYHKLPNSANLQILYIIFQAMTAVNYLLPLSIVFGMIVTEISMVKSNEIISMYALGISKQELLKPLFLSALIVSIIYIIFNFTPFSYARDYGKNLLKFNTIMTNTKDLFIKNMDDYIYFKRLDPIRKEAVGIKIFHVTKRDLDYMIEAKKGFFSKNFWILKDVIKTYKGSVESLEDDGLKVRKMKTLRTLEGFKPKIIDNVYNGNRNLSILDAIEAFKFFDAQGLNTDKIRTAIFSQLFLPLFAPILVVIFFYRVPMIPRYYNLTLYSFALAFVAIIVWGILFLLTRISFNRVVIPEIGVVLPLILLGLYAIFTHIKVQKF